MNIKRTPIINSNSPDVEIIMPTDTVANTIFHQTPENYQTFIKDKKDIIISEREPRCINTPTGKKTVVKKIAETRVSLELKKAIDECEKHSLLSEPLNPFDKDVLAACMTRQQQGKNYTTISRIYHMLGGRRTCPEPKLRQAIKDSIDKMRHIDIKINAREAYEKLCRLKDNKGIPKKVNRETTLTNYLLPAKCISAYINGKLDKEVIIFLDLSPIIEYALDKGDIVTIPKNMLSAPCINNTNTFLVLKSYIASRVQSIKRSTQGGGTKLYNILRFETIYENCGFPETAKVDRKLRKRIRDTTKEYLEYLVGIGSLKSFQCLDDQNIEQIELKNCTKFLILY